MSIILTSLLVLLLFCILAFSKIYGEWYNNGSIVSLFSFFFIFQFFDIYVPALYAVFTGSMPDKPLWVPEFSTREISEGVLLVTVTLLILWFAFDLATNLFRRNDANIGSRKHDIFNFHLAAWIYICSIVLFLVSQISVIYSMGGLLEYFLSMVKLRRSVSVLSYEEGGFLSLINHLSAVSRDVVVWLSVIFFANRKNVKGIVFFAAPLIGFLVALTTFYRGSILLYFILLFAGEQFRLQNSFIRLEDKRLKNIMSPRYQITRLAISFGFISILAFSLVGAVRSFYGAREWGVSNFDLLDGFSAEFDRFVGGSGLYSVVHIVQHFWDTNTYLNGSSIYNQLLRFIPRAIWVNKPEEYGASEINSALGYPSSTLEAVTIPGEMFANFGLLGIYLVVLFGVLGGKLESLRYSGYNQHFYYTAGLSSILAISWFSVTGFMSWFGSAVVFWLLLRFVICNKSFAR